MNEMNDIKEKAVGRRLGPCRIGGSNEPRSDAIVDRRNRV